jgi:hypothetical protein
VCQYMFGLKVPHLHSNWKEFQYQFSHLGEANKYTLWIGWTAFGAMVLFHFIKSSVQPKYVDDDDDGEEEEEEGDGDEAEKEDEEDDEDDSRVMMTMMIPSRRRHASPAPLPPPAGSARCA